MTETMHEPATSPSTLQPRGVNHLALSTCDMKAQLTYFADVLGLRHQGVVLDARRREHVSWFC